MVKVLLVGMGGFCGAVARYLLSGFVQQASGSVAFPFGTLTVNVVGCLCIGVLSELAESHGVLSVESRALIVVGVLGGFTTFSAFGNESLNLMRDGETLFALANVAGNVVLGLAAVWFGRLLVYLVWR